MTKMPWTPTLLTLLATLNTFAPTAAAASRCQADLARVTANFCLGDAFLEGAATTAKALSYQWKLDDTAFDLTAKACLSGGLAGARDDLVIALDRSQSVATVDASREKVATDELSSTTYILQKLAAEAKANPQAAPSVGLVLFSTASGCTAYKNGSIVMDREFPCLYVAAKSLADEAHLNQLTALLSAAKGLYSQGGLGASGDLTIVTKLLATAALGIAPARPAGLVLFSDGRSYTGTPADPYAYLRSGDYAAAEVAAQTAFKALAQYRLAFVLAPTVTPALDGTNADAYDTMCALPNAAAADCDPTRVKSTNPATWPVNLLDVHAFAQSLVTATGGDAKGVVQLTQPADVDQALEGLRSAAATVTTIDAASLVINGGAPQAGVVSGASVTFDNLPAGQTLTAELLLTSHGAQMKVPLTITTTQAAATGQDFADQEMLCKGDTVAPASLPPDSGPLTLKDLQGGSGSCGVAAATTTAGSPLALLVMLLLPLAALAIAHRPKRVRAALGPALLVAAAVALGGPASVARADSSLGGLNVLQYRPVVDGVANTETATVLAPGTYNAGAFMSYASNPLELGGDKGKRLAPVVDNLVTAHVVANVGLFDRVSLGVHLPYVHKSAEDRSLSGDHKAEDLGRPADAEAMLKISLVRRGNLSFGVAPLVTLPTGDASLLIGDGSANYGGLFLLSGVQGPWSWAFDAGYLQRDKKLVLADDRARPLAVTGQALSYGGGEYHQSARLAFGASIQAKVTTGSAVDFGSSNPAEWDAVAKFRPLSNLELAGGFGTGIGKGYGSPSYRVFAGLTFVPAVSAQAAGRTVAAQTAPKAAAAAAVKAPAPVAPAPVATAPAAAPVKAAAKTAAKHKGKQPSKPAAAGT